MGKGGLSQILVARVLDICEKEVGEKKKPQPSETMAKLAVMSISKTTSGSIPMNPKS